eukprot:8392732-Alexandrium_andersonii.AAC.1
MRSRRERPAPTPIPQIPERASPSQSGEESDRLELRTCEFASPPPTPTSPNPMRAQLRKDDRTKGHCCPARADSCKHLARKATSATPATLLWGVDRAG